MSLLSNAKENLTKIITQTYLSRKDDLQLDEYRDHFKSMGEQISKVDGYKTLSELIGAMESGDHQNILPYSDGYSLDQILIELMKLNGPHFDIDKW